MIYKPRASLRSDTLGAILLKNRGHREDAIPSEAISKNRGHREDAIPRKPYPKIEGIAKTRYSEETQKNLCNLSIKLCNTNSSIVSYFWAYNSCSAFAWRTHDTFEPHSMHTSPTFRPCSLPLIAASLVVNITGVHFAHDFLVPLLFPFSFVVLGTPCGGSRVVGADGVAVLIVISVIIIIITALGTIAGLRVSSLASSWPVYQLRLQEQHRYPRYLPCRQGYYHAGTTCSRLDEFP